MLISDVLRASPYGLTRYSQLYRRIVGLKLRVFRPDQVSNPTPYEHFVDLGCDSVFSRKLLIVIKGTCKKGSGRLYGNTFKNANLIPYVAYLEVSSPLQEVDP